MRKGPYKARTPIQERGVETRAKIIDAARELFSEKGYYGTNSKEIAGRAGVATGTFYSYFDDKKPLFIEVFRQYYEEITRQALEIGEIDALLEMDNRSIVHLLVSRLFEAHTIAPQFHREAVAMIYSDREIEKINDGEEKKVIEIIISFLSINKSRLRVDDIEAAAHVVHKSVEEVIHSIKIFGPKLDTERLLGGLEDMISRYLFP